MRLHLDIKPQIYLAPTKDDLLRKVGYVNCFGSYGNYSSKCNKNCVRVYNIQKINKKTKQTQIKQPAFPNITTLSKVIRKKEWIAYVYDIEVKVLEALKIKVMQGPKTFKILKKEYRF